jgi:hypothetical protein
MFIGDLTNEFEEKLFHVGRLQMSHNRNFVPNLIYFVTTDQAYDMVLFVAYRSKIMDIYQPSFRKSKVSLGRSFRYEKVTGQTLPLCNRGTEERF